jgi:regulator of PEP synthase PpsR (kinase-PPPase family)
MMFYPYSSALGFCARHNWPAIDVSRRSIEETAAAVLALLTERRRHLVS